MARKINRRAAVSGLLIQSRTHLYVVGDIGDGNQQSPAPAGNRLGINRIIEILGVLAVNGDKGQVTQVMAVSIILLTRSRGKLNDLLVDFSGPDMGNAVAAHGDIDFQPRGAAVAQNLDDTGHGLESLRGPGGNLAHHELPVLGPQGGLLGNDDFMVDATVIRDQDAKPLLGIEAAHNLGRATGQHLCDHAFLATPAVLSGNPGQNDVAVENLLHFPGAQQQVPSPLRGHEIAVTILVALHPALDQLHPVGYAKHAPAITHQLPVPTHGQQATLQGILLGIAGEFKGLTQITKLQGLRCLFKKSQDVFPAGNGIGVFFRLPLGKRILGFLAFGHGNALSCRNEGGKGPQYTQLTDRLNSRLTGSKTVVKVSLLLKGPPAQVVELVDTLASGASGRKVVEVQVLSWAPFKSEPLFPHPRIPHYGLACTRALSAIRACAASPVLLRWDKGQATNCGR